ncbi:amino acid ABC transporter permease [Phyllobacterium zundukense]|uniref:Amino acid ABC transporter permease n=1 Tax=Phyllobacterium zundukense TaxID=1867719 RepID=A0ACD4CV10_9HYPH|nr:amino acid ABC transporter permease [Phyllobacterium zundukense]UXN57391.1 amino acid ABC transporter permease [Phyllobacterium zundukense]
MDIVQTFFNLDVLRSSLPALLSGLAVTVVLGIVCAIASSVLGLTFALLRVYGAKPVRIAVAFYIDVFRSIPLLVLLVLIYYALPFVGVRLSSFSSAATALSLVAAAYAAEIFRAGFQSIPKGQFEAASAIGLGFFNTMRDVVIPQAFRLVVPPLTGNAISVLKDTALASVVAMPDLLKQATQAQSLAANPSPLVGAALLYLVLLLPLVKIVSRFENRRLSEGR